MNHSARMVLKTMTRNIGTNVPRGICAQNGGGTFGACPGRAGTWVVGVVKGTVPFTAGVFTIVTGGVLTARSSLTVPASPGSDDVRTRFSTGTWVGVGEDVPIAPVVFDDVNEEVADEPKYEPPPLLPPPLLPPELA